MNSHKVSCCCSLIPAELLHWWQWPGCSGQLGQSGGAGQHHQQQVRHRQVHQEEVTGCPRIFVLGHRQNYKNASC